MQVKRMLCSHAIGVGRDKKMFTDEILKDKSILNLLKSLLIYKDMYSKISSIEEVFIQELNLFSSKDKENEFDGKFSSLLNKILLFYHKESLFPSAQFISELIFLELKNNTDENIILRNLINGIESSNLIENSIVIHPLSDFGFETAGWDIFFSKTIKSFYFDLKSFIIFPQANNINIAINNVKTALKKFGIKNPKVSKDLFDHYLRSRKTNWFVQNPLLIQKIQQFSSTYYENQFHIVRLLEKQLILTYLTKCLSEHNKLSTSNDYLFSTNYTNNFQTYDEHHYFIVYKNLKTNVYEPECIPRHYKLSRIFDTFKLNIELPLNFGIVDKKRIIKLNDFITDIFQKLYSKEFANLNLIRRSLGYFVRSYQSEYQEDKIMFLCIAYEILLGENVKEDISGHISNNIALLLKGTNYESSKFKDFYSSRSGIAHEGKIRSCDLGYCQFLYFKIIEEIMKLYQSGINIWESNYLNLYKKEFQKKKIGFIFDTK